MKQRSFILKLVALLVLGIYGVGIFGFDVHSCSATGKSYVVPLLEGTSCEAVHPYDGCDGECHDCSHEHECEHHHDCSHSENPEDCCSDDCHLLELTGSNSSDNQNSIVLPEQLQEIVSELSSVFENIHPSHAAAGTALPLIVKDKGEFLSRISSWRL